MDKKSPEKRILNSQQKKAVAFGSGPLLIIAGAGTGKTTVITERIKHLILSNRVRPQEILALTFTEKASNEMEERIDQIMPYGYTSMWISTFHGFCDRVLRDEALHIGLTPSFQLLSETDSTMFIRKHLFSFDLDYFRPLGNPTKCIGGLLQHFSRLRDEDVTPAQYLRYAQEVKSQKSKVKSSEEEALEIQKTLELARVYKQYVDLKAKEGVMDFSDLIANTLLLFRTRKNVLKRYQEQFKSILIDEFQDTNIAQNELVYLLAGTQKNIIVVADDDQAIYRWRGAAISNVLQFRKTFPKAQLVVLSKNYRSSQTILDYSYRLIQHNNPDRLEVKEHISKKLAAVRHVAKSTVEFVLSDTAIHEAESVGKTIQSLIKEGAYTYGDIAVLVRANNHADIYMRIFDHMGIPYQFLGPEQLFQQPEIKDLIAYLQVIANHADDAALSRVLYMDYFAIAPRDIISIQNFAKKYHLSLFEAGEVCTGAKQIVNVQTPRVSDDTKEKLTRVLSLIAEHITRAHKETAGQILYFFLEKVGILQRILKDQFPIDEQQIENIAKFFSRLKNYETEHADASVAAVLDWILLGLELGESPAVSQTDWTENDMVNILTVHSSKGLEFPVVFLVNVVSERFPTRARREQIPIPDALIKETVPQGDFHLQEERRLFYVGMTRARDQVYVTAAQYYGTGKRKKKISPFVVEVFGEHVLQQHLAQSENQLPLFEWEKNSMEQPKNNLIKQPKVTYLSYSHIHTFEICPMHYKLRYLLNIPGKDSPSLSFGTSIHSALRDFYQRIIEHEKVDKQLLLSLFMKNWNPAGYRSKQHQEKMMHKGEKYLSAYFDAVMPITTKPYAVEKDFTVVVKNDGKTVKIGGRIDRIDDIGDGHIEIIDYKTGKPSKQKDVDKSLQLSMYALAATQIPSAPFGVKPENVTLSLYFFETQEKISTTRTREQLEKEAIKIVDIARAIEQSDFSCSHTMLCTTCEYQLFCGK